MAEGQTRVLTWEGKLNTEKAMALKTELLNALSKVSSLVLNIARVETLDLSIIQLFYSAIIEANSQKKEFHLIGNLADSVNEAFMAGGYTKEAYNDAHELEGRLASFCKE